MSQRVKDENPNAIVMLGFTESARILSTMIDKSIGPKSKRVYGSTANMNNTLPSQVTPRNSGLLAGMRGTLVDFGDQTFMDRLRKTDSTIRDPAYSAQAYDAVMITALAAAIAGTDEPVAVASQINGVTKNGEKCTSFAACMALVKAGKNIDYDGRAGPLEFTDPGEPCSGAYTISEFQPDDSVKPLRSTKITKCR
jgi:ABC-type branched-subunit amino acid transport system substrate-binding protein